MEISLDEEWLKQLYLVLIKFYKGSNDPVKSGYPIVTDYNPAMLSVCVNRPHTKIFGRTMFPHVLHKATINIDSIINFHPFVDGNKRMALLSTYYYLCWNGYSFNIPNDADDFTIKIAHEKLGLTEIFNWLTKNTSRSIDNVVRHWACELVAVDGKVSASKVFLDQNLFVLFFPKDGFLFFRDKIIKSTKGNNQKIVLNK